MLSDNPMHHQISREDDTPLPLQVPRPAEIPDHELLRCIGRGSYGEVWLARNIVGTYHAVKIVSRKKFEHDRPFEREFVGIQKFEPISRSHEGFIDVLQVGRNTESGYFYYVMELGDDQTSGQQINPESYVPKTLASEASLRRRLPVDDCVQIGLSLSKALSHLHQHELVHRDVKPSNVIFVTAVPKLADIGLVVGISEAHSYVGTEGFIPPEGPGTPQADIYSLGKVIYEISTGKDRRDFPELPTELADFPDYKKFLELNEVIVKACHSEVRQRYQTSREMHSDLLVMENGKSLKRLRRLEKRFANLARVGIAIGVTLIVLGSVYFQVDRARKREAESRQRRVGHYVANATSAMKEGSYFDSLQWIAEALSLDQKTPREDIHRFRFGAVFRQCPRLVQMWHQGSPISYVEFSSDGKRILIAGRNGNAQAMDVSSGRLLYGPFDDSKGLEMASFSPDGRFLITASSDKTTRVWDLHEGRIIASLAHPGRVNSARFSPDGRYIVTACEDKIARVWEVSTSKLFQQFKLHEGEVRYASFDPKSQLVVTASQDRTARIFEIATGNPVGPPFTHEAWVFEANFSPDGKRVVTASFDRTARIWAVGTDRELVPPLRHGAAVRSAAFGPDGRYILTACDDAAVRVWEANSGQLASTLLNHSSKVMHASFCPEGRRIITACWDGTVRLWDLAGMSLPSPMLPTKSSGDGSHFLIVSNDWAQAGRTGVKDSPSPRMLMNKKIDFSALNHNGSIAVTISTLATAYNGFCSQLRVWSTLTGDPISPPIRYEGQITNATLSNAGHRLAIISGNVARTFDVTAGHDLSPPLVHPQPITAEIFSSNDDRLMTISSNTVQIWDATTGWTNFPPLTHPTLVSHAEFSPDGKRLLTCTSDATFNECSAQLWDAATGKPIGRAFKHGDGVLNGTFSPNGQSVVTASEDFTAVVWNLANRRQLPLVLQHEDHVQEACFNRDGRWIVTASLDKTARVWDAMNGEPISPPLRHSWYLQHAKFINDDSQIITEEIGGSRWLWTLHPDTRPVKDLKLLCRLFSRSQRDYSEDVISLNAEDLENVWRQLKLRYPADFTTSEDEIISWHLREFELCGVRQEWSAAVFHLDWLLALRPEDKGLLQRRNRAQSKLTSERSY